MSDPRRLLDGGVQGLEREILEAGVTDGPAPPAVGKAAAALGIAGTVVGATGTAAGASVVIFPAALKLLGIGALVLGVVVVGGVELRRHGPGRETATAAQPPANQPTVPAPLPPAATTAASAPSLAPFESVSASTSGEPEPPPRARALPRAQPGTAAGHPTETELAAETAALDDARQSLRTGEPARALLALDAYGRSFPHGAMTEEATVLRIESLTRLGNRTAASSLAATFLRAHPDSPLAARVRILDPDASNP